MQGAVAARTALGAAHSQNHGGYIYIYTYTLYAYPYTLSIYTYSYTYTPFIRWVWLKSILQASSPHYNHLGSKGN